MILRLRKPSSSFLYPKKYQLQFKGGGCYGGGHLTVQVGSVYPWQYVDEPRFLSGASLGPLAVIGRCVDRGETQQVRKTLVSRSFLTFFSGDLLLLLEPLFKLCVCVRVCTQSWAALCNWMDYRRQGSSVREISQARLLEWVARPFSRGSSRPRDLVCVSCNGRWVVYH